MKKYAELAEFYPNEVFYLDIRRDFSNIPPNSVMMDSVHLFESGNKILASTITEFIKSKVKNKEFRKNIEWNNSKLCLKKGFLGFWDFDDKDDFASSMFLDISDNMRFINLIGKVKMVDGISEKAIELTGNKSHLELDGSFFSGLPTANSPFTVGFWFNTYTDTPSNIFIYGGPHIGHKSIRIGINYSTCTGCLYISDWAETYCVEDKVNDGKWHFIVLTYDGKNARIYVDNVLKQSLGLDLDLQPTLFTIGMLPPGENYFAGKIDELFIRKDVLSQNQINNIYRETLEFSKK